MSNGVSEMALPADPALASAVLEIEAHVGREGWDQPARLYALVDTATLVAQEPALASMMGIDGPGDEGSFTPIEQDGLPPGQALEEALESIVWPPSVNGCAAVVERLVLPPDVDAQIPEDRAQAEQFAREHPQRQEVRIVAGPEPVPSTARCVCGRTTMNSRLSTEPTWSRACWNCSTSPWMFPTPSPTSRKKRHERCQWGPWAPDADSAPGGAIASVSRLGDHSRSAGRVVHALERVRDLLD